MITKNQREILEHTAYRTVNGFYCGDSKDMQELICLGLMMSAGKKSFVPDEYFKLTDAGHKFLSIVSGDTIENTKKGLRHKDCNA